jgi:hypothetical protein
MSHINLVNKFLPTNYKIKFDSKNNKTLLKCYREKTTISKIQIENFAENALLSKEERSAIYIAEVTPRNVTYKGRTAEFGE